MSERESWYKSAITEWFGSLIAQNVLPEDHVIEPIFVSHINERDLHPFVQPIYRALVKQDVTTGQWAEILHLIFICKCIRKQKLGNVYKSTYETLTGRSVDPTLFDFLPYEDRHLWFRNYAESDEVISDPKKFAEHTKGCLKTNLELISLCNEYDLKIPNFDETQYFEQLNLKELYERQTPAARNNVPLSEEIKQALQELEDSFPFEDFQTIDACKSTSQITYEPEKIVVKSPPRVVISPPESAPIDHSNNTDSSLEDTPNPNTLNFSKSDTSNRSDRAKSSDRTKSSVPKSNKIEKAQISDFIDPSSITDYRPPPTNPRYSKGIFTSSPHLQTERTCITPVRNYPPTMARNIRLVDFMPTKFSPDKLDCDAEAHFLAYRDYVSAQMNEPDLDNIEVPQEKLDMFKFTCTGEARLWYETNKPFEGLHDLESKFLKEYADGLQSTTTAAKAFSELQYNPKTKLTSFVNKIMRLNRSLNYSDNVLRDRLMSAVPADIRRLAKLQRPSSFRDTIEAIRSVLEDQSTESSTVAMINNEEVTESLNDLSLHINNMRRDINNMSNRVRNPFQPRQANFRPNTNQYYKSFQNNRGFRQADQGNGRPPPRQMGSHDDRRFNQTTSQSNFRRGQFHNFRGRDYGRQQPDRSKVNIQCFACNKFGHYKRDCRNRRFPNNNRRFNPDNQRGNNDYQPRQNQQQ